MSDRASSRSVCVVGAGGHAKVVVATLEEIGTTVAAILDDDETKWGTDLLGHTISGPADRAAEMDCMCILAIGDNRIRRRLALGLPKGMRWATAIHPTACIHPTVQVGEGTVVFAGAIVQPDTRIGSHAIINTGATIDHDGSIRDYVHIGPGAHLAGDVTVEEGALMGVGSLAIPGVHIGAWTTVGAGGVVTRNLGPELTAVGVPARPSERLTSRR